MECVTNHSLSINATVTIPEGWTRDGLCSCDLIKSIFYWAAGATLGGIAWKLYTF